MKKIFVALSACLILSLPLMAQKTVSPADARKAVEKAEQNAANEKKAAKVGTWLDLAKAYMQAYYAPIGNGRIGSDQQELALTMYNERPLSSENVEVRGNTYRKDVYEARNYYFNTGGILAIIEVTRPVYEDALDRAWEAYKKAVEVDPQGKKAKDITAGLKTIAEKNAENGGFFFQLGRFEDAATAFEKAAAVAATAPLNETDTLSLFNAGLSAWNASQFERAIRNYTFCEEKGYTNKGELFVYISMAAAQMGDKEKQLSSLRKGFELYPENQDVLASLIDFYVSNNGDPNEIIDLLNRAKANDPGNAALYYVEGNVQSQLGNYDAAVAAYDKSVEVKPDYDFGYYAKGSFYIERANKLNSDAAMVADNSYLEMLKQADEYYRLAIEPLEKCYVISKNDDLRMACAQTLKQLYYKQYANDESPENKARYDKYNNIVKTGVLE